MRRFLAASLVLALCASNASATLVEALDWDELVARADVIAVGRVVAQSPRRDAEGRILTDVEFEVEEGLQGIEAGEGFVLTVLGGEIGDIGMQIAGEPAFSTGDRALIFARRWQQTLRPVGMSQGTMPISRIAGHDLVSPGGSGLALMRRGADGSLEHSAGALAQPTTLPRVLDTVRALLNP